MYTNIFHRQALEKKSRINKTQVATFLSSRHEIRNAQS